MTRSRRFSVRAVFAALAVAAVVAVAGLVAVGGVLAVAPAAAATPPALGASGAASPAPRAQLTGLTCLQALDPAGRTIAIQAVMRPVPRTRRMAVRFELLALPGSPAGGVAGATVTRPTAVHGPGLGVWIHPTNPTLGQLPGDVWRVDKQVLNLAAPAAYEFRVSFRWTGSHGQVLQTVTRSTRSCRVRELRPDLAVQSLTVSAIPGRTDADLYTAVIADQGATGAGPFEVLLTSTAAPAPLIRTIGFLRAGETRQLTFTGPVCGPSSSVTVTVDATDEVDDYDRANNTLTLSPSCAGAPLESMSR